MYGHKDSVKAVIIADNIIHSLSADGTIRASHIPPFSKFLNYSSSKIQELIHNPGKNLTFFINSANELYELGQSTIITKFSSVHIGWSFTKSSLVVFHSKDSVSTNIISYIIDLTPPYTNHRSLELKTSSIPSVSIAADYLNYVITGELYRITVWNNTNGNQEHIFRSHSANITSMTAFQEYIFAGDESGSIKQYSLASFNVTANFNEIHNSPIQILKVSDEFLFSAATNFSLTIWNIQTKSSVFRIEFPSFIKKIQQSLDFEYFFVNHGSKIEV